MQVDLFPGAPRRPPIKRMQVVDAGESGNGKVIAFRCPQCGHETGWIRDEHTVSENKRGLPCPICNA